MDELDQFVVLHHRGWKKCGKPHPRTTQVPYLYPLMGKFSATMAVDKVKVDGEQQEPPQEVLQRGRWKRGCTLPWVHRWGAGFPRSRR
jgi:hypothetical protein